VNALEHPPVIEEHEIEPDARVPRNLERRVDVGEEMRIGSLWQPSIVVGDAASAVSEDEPPHHREAERGHARKVSRDRGTPRRNAEM